MDSDIPAKRTSLIIVKGTTGKYVLRLQFITTLSKTLGDGSNVSSQVLLNVPQEARTLRQQWQRCLTQDVAVVSHEVSVSVPRLQKLPDEPPKSLAALLQQGLIDFASEINFIMFFDGLDNLDESHIVGSVMRHFYLPLEAEYKPRIISFLGGCHGAQPFDNNLFITEELMCSRIYGLDPQEREKCIASLAKPDDLVTLYDIEGFGKGTNLYRAIHSCDDKEEHLQKQFDTARDMCVCPLSGIITLALTLLHHPATESSVKPPLTLYGDAT